MFTVNLDNRVVKVKFQHFTTNSDDKKKRRFCSRVIVRIFNPDEYVRSEQTAVYNPKDSEFSKNLGKKFAFQKVMNVLKGQFSKKERQSLWEVFFLNFNM